MTDTKSKKTSRVKATESKPATAPAPKKQRAAKKEENRVKFEVGQSVKRPSKNLSGTVLSVVVDKDGFTSKATVKWENGMQYAISYLEIVAN